MAQASAEILQHTGPAETERVASVPQRKQLESMPEPPLPKRKETEPSVQSTRSWGGGEERVKVDESYTLTRERGSEPEYEEKTVDSTVKEVRFHGGKGGQAKRASQEEVKGSMSK